MSSARKCLSHAIKLVLIVSSHVSWLVPLLWWFICGIWLLMSNMSLWIAASLQCGSAYTGQFSGHLCRVDSILASLWVNRGLKSLPWDRLYWPRFSVVFISNRQANVWTVSQIGLWNIPSTSFLIRYLLAIILFNAVQYRLGYRERC
jgi:hypothetical protein